MRLDGSWVLRAFVALSGLEGFAISDRDGLSHVPWWRRAHVRDEVY